MSECKLNKKTFDSDKNFVFINKNTGEFINTKSIELTPSGELSSITTYEEFQILPEDCKYERYLINIPGIGYITPGTRVVYNKKDYLLQFGWHTNISNQTIYSWYLSPLEENIPDKTLYKEMINQINIIHFR